MCKHQVYLSVGLFVYDGEDDIALLSQTLEHVLMRSVPRSFGLQTNAPLGRERQVVSVSPDVLVFRGRDDPDSSIGVGALGAEVGRA